MPDDVVAGFGVDGRTCIAAVTHDPKLDDLALLEALNADAFYNGAIGSRRSVHTPPAWHVARAKTAQAMAAGSG